MLHKRLTFLFVASVFLSPPSSNAEAQQIYKWTDASGQVHYGEKKPENIGPTQTLDITPPPAAAPANTDNAAEIARINALSEQMARERQATQQHNQEQAIRNLEQENQQLQKSLNQQFEQQQQRNDDNDNIVMYPPPGPQPPHPPKPHPPYPCQPWPDCHKPPPPEPPKPPPPEPPKPNPPFNPKPVGADPAR